MKVAASMKPIQPADVVRGQYSGYLDEAGVPVQPVALRYGPRGSAQPVVAFGPKESFFANFVRLLGEPGHAVERR